MPSALSVLFTSPFAGTSHVSEENRLKSYLAIGTLASALRDGSFLRLFAHRMAAASPIGVGDPPAVRVELLQLDGKPAGQTISGFLAERTAALHLRPDILAMTATSVHLEQAEEFATAAIRHFPQALRVIGGPHVSVLPEDFLRNSDFHAACIGEGVETMAELALRWPLAGETDLSRIAGIAFKDGRGNVHRTAPRRPLFLLDDYPFPSESLELFWPHLGAPEQNARFPVSVLAGFGCPHDCIFCAQRCIHAGKVRERSAENIFAEVERLYARGFRKFAFVQETFLNSRRRVRRFCELVETSGLGIEWTVEARADQVSRKGLMEMRSAGLKFLQLGVESGDEELLQAIGKGVRRNQIVRVTEWCRELRIHSAFYMLVGLPGQGWQSILRSALLIWGHTPYNLLTRHVSVAIAIPYPGTRIARDGTVRVINWARRDWPERNPPVELGNEGEFLGRSYTETDDMTAAEIFEAWLYLDDFCHFLMDARLGETDDPEARTKSMGYAERLLDMLQRRTIRDLIVRARPDLSPEQRRSAYDEMVAMDDGAEAHLKDVAPQYQPPLCIMLSRFLASVAFRNGFDTMKQLSVGNRIRWMKICSILWQTLSGAFNHVQFEIDSAENGRDRNAILETIASAHLDACLDRPDIFIEEVAVEDIKVERRIQAFGFRFYLDREKKLLIAF
jgi:anaerobic magnesium-protoporphyrin IX monomethyl ester cyclase